MALLNKGSDYMLLRKLKLNKKNKVGKNLLSFKLILVIFLFIFGIMCITEPKTKLITKTINKLLGVYTEEIKSVEIQSSDYDDPGSWHIDKSAKWTGTNKAQVTFDVNSIIKTGNHYKDIILVLDISGSMEGDKIDRAISDSKELISYLLTDTNNRAAIITFDSTSSIISEFSSNKDDLLTKLDTISVTGCTNYNAALQNVDIVMDGYTKEANRDIVTLFLTDGYPNEDTPNQIGTYEILKDKYPYMIINGVQYEMGKDVIDEIKQITDSQWVADQSTLNNVLFEASISPIVYEDFIVTDYIHDDYFKINSVDDIKVTIGEVTLTEEEGLQKITWNLGKNTYMTGVNAKMYINLTLKEQYVETEGFYPTNKKETIESKLPEENTKTINSNDTPVLKNNYEVIYDTNTPDGCSLPSIPREKHFIYQNVTKKTEELSCSGYLFKGWEIDEDDAKDIKMVNDDVFVMPEHDVHIRATWTRQSIAKTMDGTVHEKTTLYKVLENEAKIGTYAKKYTGAHQDSMDASLSTQKIYYWFGSNNTNGTAILDKNNVIFAGQCFQMIRTTDTGGVKMIYNGEAVDGKCLSTRGTHVGYAARTTQTLNTIYYYGTSYTYDSAAKNFKLSGTVTAGTIKTGEYTCKATAADASCSTLYYVDTLSSGTTYYVLPINSNSHYSQFGTLQFNQQYNSPSYVGYMYNIVYPFQSKTMTSSEYMLSSSYLGTNYWYAHDVVWGSPAANSYNLNSPYQVSVTTDYPNLVGEYTFGSTTEAYTNTSVYYIAAVNNSSYYYIQMDNTGNRTLAYFNFSYTYGDSFTDNGDGTYTIDSPTTVERKDWYTNYSSVRNKYVCKNATNDTCSELWYATATTNTSMTYIEVANNYKYAKGFTWDGSKYVLDDDTSTTFWNINDSTNKTSLNNAHYTCWNSSGECTTISYIYYLSGTIPYYINITDGKSVEEAINEMLYNDNVNTTNSTIKTGVDAWFEKNLLEYSDYLEDTVFCNDRSQSNLSLNGWNPNGGRISDYLYFKEYIVTSDLSCTNETDRFSTLNDKAKLKYKVGLMSSPEMNILYNSNILKTGQYYWLASPIIFIANANGGVVTGNGDLSNYHLGTSKNGVRPAVSLAPDTEYSDGDGSRENPYVVDLGD